MNELMRHQQLLRIEAINSIIKLLNQHIELSKNPSFVCQRQNTNNTKIVLSRSSDNRNNERVTATGVTRHRRSSRNMASQTYEDEEYENTMLVDSECTSSYTRSSLVQIVSTIYILSKFS